MKLRICLLFIVILLMACSPSGAEPDFVEPTPTEINPDAQYYADDFGVSLEEANRRLQQQEALGTLAEMLRTNEADSFAGLWIEHEPAYKIVIAVVGDGDAVIRPYLTNLSFADDVEIRPAQHTLAELEAAQQEAFAIIDQLDSLSIGGGIDVKTNQVVLTVGNPDLFLDAVAAAGYTLPPLVVVEPINPNNIPESNQGGVTEYSGPDGQTIYFPRQAPTIGGMAALLEGRLILDENGCLRVQPEDASFKDAPVVVWHYDFTLTVENGEIVIWNGMGEPVGRVGEWTRMGGGQSHSLAQPDMPAGCPSPYWILGQIETIEEQAIPDIYLQPVGSGGRTVFYFQSKAAADEGSISGTLTIDDDGCFRVAGYTIFWPPDIWPDEDANPLQIVYRKDGVEAVMFAVGDEIELAGGEKTAVDYRFFDNKIICQGSFWGVAQLTPN